MKKILLLMTAMVLISVSAWAVDIDPKQLTLTGTVQQQQQNFKDLSKEIGFGLSYFPMAPAEPLGILGFDIGVEVTALDINEDKPYWKQMGDFPGMLPIPRLHLQKGLPFGIDVGAIYSSIPSTNISLWGGEVKWAFLKGSIATPAVALRGTYTKLNGVNNLDLNTMGYDISISKGFTILTPYAGVGQVKIDSDPKNIPLNPLTKESITETKYFAGLRVSLGLINMVAEADFAEVPAYSLKLGVGF
ncbi:MAG: DUF6588 family protein [Thermodesulfobacteriota bacterium]